MIAGIEKGQSFLDDFAENARGRGKVDQNRFSLLTPADISKLPPARFLVRGVLPMEGLAAIFGPPACGKSFLVADVLGAIDRGDDWFGHSLRHSVPCFYIGLEGEAGVSQRVRALQSEKGLLSDRFHFLLQPLDIRLEKDRADLVAAARLAGVINGVVVVDTLNRSAPGMDENSSVDMGLVISAAKAIQAELGGLLILLHHTGKNAANGLRGHSSLLAALDCAIEVSRDGDRRSWKVAKSKDGNDEVSHGFRLDVVELGADEDGEPITSCVVAPERSAADIVRRVLPPKAGNQRIVWEALGEILKASEHYGQAGAAPTRPCVRLEDAIEKARTRLVCDPKRQTERARSAITSLISNGQIIHREGWLWIA